MQSAGGYIQLYTPRKPQWHVARRILHLSQEDTRQASQAAAIAGSKSALGDLTASPQAAHPAPRQEKRNGWAETGFDRLCPTWAQDSHRHGAAHSAAGHPSPRPHKDSACRPAVSLRPTKAETVANVGPNTSACPPRMSSRLVLLQRSKRTACCVRWHFIQDCVLFSLRK